MVCSLSFVLKERQRRITSPFAIHTGTQPPLQGCGIRFLFLIASLPFILLDNATASSANGNR